MKKNYNYLAAFGIRTIPLLVGAISLMAATLTVGLDSQKLEFDIYLNDKKVGQQSVLITLTETGEKIVIESQFNIKLLFVTVFSYKHTANEVWRDTCLQSIDSTTKENGDRFLLESNRINQGLSITNNSGTRDLQGCIRSFAYWDLQRLDSKLLLNGQTGKYVPTTLVAKGEEKFLVNEKEIMASHYTLSAESSEINLWYDKDQNWVGLSTVVKGGRTLSYRLR